MGRAQFIFFSVYQTPPLEDQISHIVTPRVDYAPTTSKLLVDDQDAAATSFHIPYPLPNLALSRSSYLIPYPRLSFSYPLCYCALTSRVTSKGISWGFDSAGRPRKKTAILLMRKQRNIQRKRRKDGEGAEQKRGESFPALPRYVSFVSSCLFRTSVRRSHTHALASRTAGYVAVEAPGYSLAAIEYLVTIIKALTLYFG